MTAVKFQGTLGVVIHVHVVSAVIGTSESYIHFDTFKKCLSLSNPRTEYL